MRLSLIQLLVVGAGTASVARPLSQVDERRPSALTRRDEGCPAIRAPLKLQHQVWCTHQRDCSAHLDAESFIPDYGQWKPPADHEFKITQMRKFQDEFASGHQVELLGSDFRACTYALKWKDETVILAKTSKIPDKPVGEMEIDVLDTVLSRRCSFEFDTCADDLSFQVGLFRGRVKTRLEGETSDRLFVFQTFVHGVRLEDTVGYREKVSREGLKRRDFDNDKHTCIAFMRNTARKIFAVRRYYQKDFGVIHGDVQIHNVLFDRSWDGVEGEVRLVNWAMSYLIPPISDKTDERKREALSETIAKWENMYTEQSIFKELEIQCQTTMFSSW